MNSSRITSAEFLISSSRADKCPAEQRPEYAFIGRSNVGKSSLINMLTGRKGLAKTSSTPGKTLLINHFLINRKWFLVDLPGYGYAKRSKRETAALKSLILHYVLERAQLTCLFVLIDARLSPQKVDLEFIHMLGLNGVPFCLVFTKADKIRAHELQANVKAFLDHLGEEWEELPPHFITSSEKGTGRDELLAYIHQVNQQLSA